LKDRPSRPADEEAATPKQINYMQDLSEATCEPVSFDEDEPLTKGLIGGEINRLQKKLAEQEAEAAKDQAKTEAASAEAWAAAEARRELKDMKERLGEIPKDLPSSPAPAQPVNPSPDSTISPAPVWEKTYQEWLRELPAGELENLRQLKHRDLKNAQNANQMKKAEILAREIRFINSEKRDRDSRSRPGIKPRGGGER